MPVQPDAPLFDLDDADYQHALAILLDVGLSIAKDLKTPGENGTAIARGAAFEGVARAVRRSIVLSRHIRDAIPAAAQKRAEEQATRSQARRQVLRRVEDAINRKVTHLAEAAPLRAELLERIDAPEFAEDLANRSPDALVAEICRDLGLAALPGTRPDLRRTPDDIAILAAQAAAPSGSGLPQWIGAADPQARLNDAARRPCDERRIL